MRVVLTLIARGQTKMRVDGESVDESCMSCLGCLIAPEDES